MISDLLQEISKGKEKNTLFCSGRFYFFAFWYKIHQRWKRGEFRPKNVIPAFQQIILFTMTLSFCFHLISDVFQKSKTVKSGAAKKEDFFRSVPESAILLIQNRIAFMRSGTGWLKRQIFPGQNKSSFFSSSLRSLSPEMRPDLN